MSFLERIWSKLVRRWFTSRTSAARLRRHLECLSLERRDCPAVMQVGMNLERVIDSNPDWMFTDAMLESRPWTSWQYNVATRLQTQGGTLHVDEHGWPTSLDDTTNAQGQEVQQRLSATMYTAMDGHYPAGQYHAQWTGTGTLSWTRDAHLVSQSTDPDGTHHATIDVSSPTAQGIELRIDAMSSADPIRNLHLWVPDYNGQSFVGQVWRPGSPFSPFHPLYLERLQPFGTIRSMQAQTTIPSDIVHWSDRKHVGDATQSTAATTFQNGIAPEYLIELANELHSNPWLCMPHLADDDYVRGFATLVHDSLEPGRTVYVEWSNELWNPSFGYEGHQWLREQAAATGRDFYEIWAAEAKRDFAIWSEVFANDPSRLVRVVAGQAANSWVVGQVLSHMDGQFDAISCDGYVTFARPQLEQFSAATTADQVVDALSSQALPNTVTFLQNHKAIADQYSRSLGRHIQVVTYEGGPLLSGNGFPFGPAFLEAVRGPRMYELYRQLLVAANNVGVDLFTAYVFTDSSPFGDSSTLRYQDQPIADAHRYRGLVDAAHGAFYSLNPPTPLPAVTIVGAPAQIVEGSSARLSAAFTTPTSLTTAFAWTASLNGVPFASGSGTSFAPAPPDDGTVVVTCVATGPDGQRSESSVSFRSVNAPPTGLQIAGPPSTTLGVAISLTATFTDPGSADVFRHRWQIVDNRGVIVASGTTATIKFSPPAVGTYYVTWEVTDDDGGRAVTSRSFSVLPAVRPPLTLLVQPKRLIHG